MVWTISQWRLAQYHCQIQDKDYVYKTVEFLKFTENHTVLRKKCVCIFAVLVARKSHNVGKKSYKCFWWTAIHPNVIRYTLTILYHTLNVYYVDFPIQSSAELWKLLWETNRCQTMHVFWFFFNYARYPYHTTLAWRVIYTDSSFLYCFGPYLKSVWNCKWNEVIIFGIVWRVKCVEIRSICQ